MQIGGRLRQPQVRIVLILPSSFPPALFSLRRICAVWARSCRGPRATLPQQAPLTRLNDQLLLHCKGIHELEGLEDYTEVTTLWLQQVPVWPHGARPSGCFPCCFLGVHAAHVVPRMDLW